MYKRQVPFTADLVEPTRQFNTRLRGHGITIFQAEEDPVITHELDGPHPITRENFVVVDDKANSVCGSYSMVYMDFLVRGEERRTGFIQIPISEGIINPKYVPVGIMILKDAFARSPLSFGLGMGGRGQPVTKLHVLLKAKVEDVPFFFRVCHAGPFLENLDLLRKSPAKRAAAKVARWTGLGALGAGAVHLVRGGPVRLPRGLQVEPVRDFSGWADELWREARGAYTLAMVRDSSVLNFLYEPQGGRFHCLRLLRGAKTTGWAALLDTQMREHNHFHNMRVGTIVDQFSLPGEEAAVIGAATHFLARRGVDLIVSNQLHPAWRGAFATCGYLSGPSNFVLSRSPAFYQQSADPAGERVHITRGDGDGPWNL